jgi:hypothetical protein
MAISLAGCPAALSCDINEVEGYFRLSRSNFPSQSSPRWEGFFASEGDQKQYVLQTFWPPLGWQAVVQRLREDAATGPAASGILPAKHSCINLL